MTSVRSNNVSLKYQRFTTLDFKDIGIRKSEFVAKNQLFCPVFYRLIEDKYSIYFSTQTSRMKVRLGEWNVRSQSER